MSTSTHALFQWNIMVKGYISWQFSEILSKCNTGYLVHVTSCLNKTIIINEGSNSPYLSFGFITFTILMKIRKFYNFSLTNMHLAIRSIQKQQDSPNHNYSFTYLIHLTPFEKNYFVVLKHEFQIFLANSQLQCQTFQRCMIKM